MIRRRRANTEDKKPKFRWLNLIACIALMIVAYIIIAIYLALSDDSKNPNDSFGYLFLTFISVCTLVLISGANLVRVLKKTKLF